MNRPAPARPAQSQTPRRDDDRDRVNSSPTQQGEQQTPNFDARPKPQTYTGSGNGAGFEEPLNVPDEQELAPQVVPGDERDDARNQHFPHGDESTYGSGNQARPNKRH